MLEINKIHQGDCIEEMKKLPDNSVDAIITDPPYELGFMGKSWDSSGIANDINMWKEALRVLKHGGFLLSFGGTRTYHRMACAIEDAGFEIRDCIQWLYGSGFPKSLNVGKQIDKIQGNEREFICKNPANRPYNLTKGETSTGWKSPPRPDKDRGNSIGEGWGTALKPANEPIVVARKPLSEKNVALNVLKWGTGGINIDGCRIGNDMIKSCGGRKEIVTGDDRVGKALGMNAPHKPLNTIHQGRFPANVILDEVAGKMLNEQSGLLKPQGNKLGKTIQGKQSGMFNTKGIVNDSNNYKDIGGASRFFKNIIYAKNYLNRKELDKLCYENIPVKDVERSLMTMNLIDYQRINSAQRNVLPNIISQNQNLNALFAEKNVENIEIDSAQELVQTLTNGILEFMVRGQSFLTTYELTQVQLQGIIILNQNLVSSVEKKEKSDIMKIIQNLKILFGCAEVVTINITEENCRFRYVAKASKSERNYGCEEMEFKRESDRNKDDGVGGANARNRTNTPKQNFHPTVKPLKLMQYLVRLVCRKNGIVLDLFIGSGTTAIACVKEGMNFIGIEKEEEYIKIANARLKPHLEQQRLIK